MNIREILVKEFVSDEELVFVANNELVNFEPWGFECEEKDEELGYIMDYKYKVTNKVNDEVYYIKNRKYKKF